MAVKGTQKVLGGTPYKRYPDPNVTGTPNQFGLYPWSAFRAALGFVDVDGSITYYQDGLLDRSDSSACEFLFFVSDIPAVATAVSYDTLKRVAYPSTIENKFSSTSILAPTSGGAAGVTGLQYGKVLSGYAGASKQVFCTGFSAVASFYGPNEAVSNQYAVECLCNSPVVCSPVGSNNILKGNVLSPISLILNDTDYTQAMYDAGNLFTDSSGFLFQIVGLFYHTYTPPALKEVG
jgi:hypothetical protein